MIPKRHIEARIGTEVLTAVDADASELSTQDIVVAGLHMQFTITRSLSSEPNEGELKIWNLATETANKVMASGKTVAIQAGYSLNSGIVFNGDIRDVNQARTHSGKLGAIKSEVQNVQKGVNYLTLIKLGGNFRKLTESYFSRSYAGTVDITTIVQDAVNTTGLAVRGLNLLIPKTFSDFSFSGRTKDLLDLITAEPYPLSWYEDNGSMVFTKFGEAGTEQVIRISEETGLLGAPEVIEDGIRFTSMLNPAIAPGSLLEMNSSQVPQVKGEWKVRKTVITGDNRDGDHIVEVEAVPNG